MAGETLPPVVAVLQGDISDLVAKIAEAKAAVESLDGVTGTAKAELDLAPLESSLAEAEAMIRAFSQQSGNIEMSASINMAPAVAEFAAGAAAMRIAADAASGGAGGGGLLALLGWGGGTFGFAAFGSVLALAGFGFEHLVTTVLGLAGSLSGALVGALTLAAGAFSVMAVGELTDMAGIGQAMGDIKNVVTAQNALTQAVAVYGPTSTQAAVAQAQLNYTLSSFSPVARAAVLEAANTAQAFHQMFNSATGAAESIGAQIINQAMLIGEDFLPTIGKYAASNLGVIQAYLQPLFEWLSTVGLGIFTQLEDKFSQDLPAAMDAFDNAVELVIKILGYAAQQTGGFIQWLDAFFLKWNSAAEWPSVEKGINTVIGLFHTWWDLLKQIALTIYDVFSKTVGLGTSIVQIITQMLIKLDAWIQSTAGSGSLHNLFEAHLAEIKEILDVLPMLLSSFGQLYLMIAPDLTRIVTGLVAVVGWMLKIPVAGPLIAWGLAIAFFMQKMQLLTIGGAIITGMKSMAIAAGAISAAFSAGGMMAGLNALKTFFTGGNWANLFKSGSLSVSLNASQLDANTAALTRLTAVMGGEGVGGLGGAAGGAGGGAGAGGLSGLPGVLSEVAAFGSDLSVVLGPLVALPAAILGIIAVVNALPHYSPPSPTVQGPGTGGAPSGVAKIQQAYAATWQALLDSNNSMYKNSALFQQNLQTDLTAAGIPLGQVPGDATYIASQFANGRITSATQLANIIKDLAATATGTGASAQAAAAAAVQNKEIAATTASAEQLIGKGFNTVQVNLILWESALEKAGVSGSVGAAAQAALSNFIKVHGPVTANEMAGFQFAATATNASAKSMSQDAAALSSFVSKHGPITAQELQLYENAITASKGNGLIVQQDMAVLSAFVSKHGPLTATEFGIFQTLITTSGVSAGTINSVMGAVAAYVQIHGPLVNAQMLAVQNDIANGVTSVADINISLRGINDAMSSAVPYAQEYLRMIKLGASEAAAIATARGLSGGGGYTAAAGGVTNAPSSGQLWMLHGVEAIVPKDKAGWLWEPMLTAISSGKPPAFLPPPPVGASVSPSMITPITTGGSGGRGSVTPQYQVSITMPGGVNLSPQVIAAAVAQGLEQHDTNLMRMIATTPRVGAMQ